MEEVTFFIHPLIKEILEQQRLILEMQKCLVEVLSHPPLIYKAGEDSPIRSAK